MSFGLLDTIKGYFGGETVSNAAAQLGESESGVSKAVNAIIAALLGVIASKASSSQGAEEVAAMAKEFNNSSILGNVAGAVGNGEWMASGIGIVKSLFGEKLDSNMIAPIAEASGLKTSSATSLMGVAAPVTLGAIGAYAAQNNLGASGISALLANSKNQWSGTIPAGVSIPGAIINITKQTTMDTHHDDQHSNTHEQPAAEGVRWLVPLIILAVLSFLAWWLLQTKGCSKTPEHATTHGDTTKPHGDDTLLAKTAGMPKLTIDSTGIVSYELGKEIEFTLPDGTKIMAAENGFESQLLQFIKTGTIDSVNKKANWLNMFDVQFKSGGSEYIGKAQKQVANCGAILKAYPNVKIKLGGYTDNSGAADVNKRVSQQRADKVKADLLKMGATAAQITESVGYGPDFPVCEANDTPECKARNRRVACKVAAK